jgi:hypothetical protein
MREHFATLADLRPIDYPARWRHMLESLLISDAAYRQTAQRHRLPTPSFWSDGASNADPYKGPGSAKRSVMPLVMAEHELRTTAGQARASNADEARDLLAWVKKEHPLAPHPSRRTIANAIGRARHKR